MDDADKFPIYYPTLLEETTTDSGNESEGVRGDDERKKAQCFWK